MLHEKNLGLELNSFEMMKELVSSINDVNVRIKQLKGLLQDGFIKEEKRVEVRDILFRMKESRMMLLYSMLDTRNAFIRDISYKNGDKREEAERNFSIENLYRLVKSNG